MFTWLIYPVMTLGLSSDTSLSSFGSPRFQHSTWTKPRTLSWSTETESVSSLAVPSKRDQLQQRMVRLKWFIPLSQLAILKLIQTTTWHSNSQVIRKLSLCLNNSIRKILKQEQKLDTLTSTRYRFTLSLSENFFSSSLCTFAALRVRFWN